MKAVVWNVRGLNMKEKHKELRDLIRSQGFLIIGAVKTKVRESRSKRIKSIKESGEIFTIRLRMRTRSKGESGCCGIPIS